MIDFGVICGRNSAKRGNPSSGQFATWAREAQLDIQASQVPSLQTNHPILLDENVLPSDIWATALNGGGDLRFASDYQGANRLSCEIVNFDTVLQRAEIWVLMPSISSVINTPIYIFYGKAGQSQPAAAAAFGKYATWASSNLLAVYHLQGNGNDATSNQTNSVGGGGNNPSYNTYKLGQYATFNGVDQGLDYNKLPAVTSNTFTFSAWARPHTVPSGSVRSIFSHEESTPNGNLHIEQGTTNDLLCAIQGIGFKVSSWTFTINSWQHIAITYNNPGNSVKFYKNVSTVSSQAWTGQAVDFDCKDINIGTWWNPFAFSRHFDGDLDELRIYTDEKDANFLTVEYNNQNSISSFINVNSYVYQ